MRSYKTAPQGLQVKCKCQERAEKRLRIRGEAKCNSEAVYSQPSSPKSPETKPESTEDMMTPYSACHQPVPLLGSWLQVGDWGTAKVVEDTGGCLEGW